VFRDSPLGQVDAEQVASGLHWSGSRDALKEVASNGSDRARIFLGYAGWGPGQLEGEIANGGWLVVPMSEPRAESLVFETARDEIWTAAVRSLGIEPGTLVATQGIN